MGLKRSDLAEWTNMTTANVIRTLSSFSVERLIEVRGRNIKILDEASLKQIYQLN
ncbi:MAG: winged helix-turn-helix domain-containing protein [Saprospiraceae bacterium]|nr:winged helix-turn-helix domain-containing protein [Saprospiraceae bacterium]